MVKNSFLKAMLLMMFITVISTINSNVYSGNDGLGNSTNKTIASGGAILKNIPDAGINPSPTPPTQPTATVTTNAATSINTTTATLNGSATAPYGSTLSYYFEYGTTTS